MDDGKALRLAAVARKWLENPRVGYDGEDAGANRGHALSSLVLARLSVSVAEPGRVVCSFRVPAQLTVRPPACLFLHARARARAYG